ncbi:MAG TPA: 5-formyltetrahydrofolate cyclo-ligase [Caulobacteraceae bacterium]|nr:5-formyltetrahydrofolate cyclo-ligase [Caulobacteraceae bacterium]
MAASSPHDAKTLMRQLMRAQRRGLAQAAPEAGRRAAALLPLETLPKFAVVSGYRPQSAEIDPLPLMHRLREAGARLALPVAVSRDAPLIFRAYDRDAALVPDAFGIPSPPPEAEVLTPDLVIAPLMAFDRTGARLGQGAGHYDRTLENLRAGGKVFVLGLAFAGQEVARVPAEPHDQRLDAILTETGYIEAR